MDGKEKKRKTIKKNYATNQSRSLSQLLFITVWSPQLIVVIAVSSNANQIKVVRVGSLGDGVNSNMFLKIVYCVVLEYVGKSKIGVLMLQPKATSKTAT